MLLHKLPKIVQRRSKRVGRGIGSGKGGHTSGRGTKGQKAREKVPLIFEGTKFKKSLIKRLPFLRGRGKLKPWGNRPVIVNFNQLADFAGTEVTVEVLIKAGIVGQEALTRGVKILGGGKLVKPLKFKVPASFKASAKIEKAGGKMMEA